MTDILRQLTARDPGEKEFHQAVREVLDAVAPVLERHPEYRRNAILERLFEPERTILFRVPWMDDRQQFHVHRGCRVEMSSAIGPYKGGLRFHPSVTLGILKSLALENVFKNALTPLSMGGAHGGSDFDPKGRSDTEIMRFCQSFVTELFRHIGPHTDIPEGDIGVGAREIGFLFGMYRKLRNEFTGSFTGKSLDWGGSVLRREAAGYGVVYFAAEMLAARGESLEGKVCLVSGAGNVAQHAAEKLVAMGAKVVSLSDSSGAIYDEEGFDPAKIDFIKRLKNIRRARIGEYVDKYSQAVYLERDFRLDHNPLWKIPCDCAFPCATENEIQGKDAAHLVEHGVRLVVEGASMASTPEAVRIFEERGTAYAPGKAANAGGVVVSGLEMAQNSMRITWTAEEVDRRLQAGMKGIHRSCLEAAERYGRPGNILVGANIAGFLKVVRALLDQGLV